MIKRFHIIAFFLFSIQFTYGQTTEETALAKIAELEALISSAEDDGIDATREKLSVKVAETFLYLADWDENNIDHNESIFGSGSVLPKEISKQYTDRQLAELLPEHERSEVVKLLTEAIDNLNKVISGEVNRKPTFNPDYTRLDIEGTRIVQDGKPAFLAEWIFKPESAGPHNLTEYFGDLGGIFLRPTDMEKNEQGEISLKAATKRDLDAFSTPGSFGVGFLGQRNIVVPAYISDEYPEIFDGASLHTGFDIDHPKAREFHEDFFKLVVPRMKDSNHSKLGYLLTNEPHWNIDGTWAVVDPTQYTKDKFAIWLEERHTEIANLNTLWNTSFTSFEEAGNSFKTPISSITSQGTPRWYDLVRFNQVRVIEWYEFLNKIIKTEDPAAKTHLKLIPTMFSLGISTTGLDFERLIEMSDIVGNDANMANSEPWDGASVSDYWKGKYSLEWRNTAVSYDFLSSILPNATNYNSEGGLTGWGAFRDLFLEPSYLRAAHWIAVIQGMDMVNNWCWGRNTSGVTREGHTSFVDMMPQTLNTVHLTMMELNAHGEEMSLIQDMDRPIRIFYSETSAVNKSSYLEGEIQEIYDELFFEGYKIGFATERIINNHDNDNWEVIVIRNTERVTSDELEALQSYLNGGGTIIIDENSIKEDEYGRSLSGSLSAGNGKLIATTTEALASNAISEVRGKGIIPVVTVTETNTQGGDFKGVIRRAIDMNAGKRVVTLVNVGLTDATVKLGLPGYGGKLSIQNMVNGQFLENDVVLEPDGVLLLEVSEAISTNCTNVTFYHQQLKSYDGDEDNGTASIQDEQLTLLVDKNGWKAIPFSYEITANTKLKFDFRADSEGEEHSIGFDDDLISSDDRRFKLFGTESGNSIEDFDDYEGNGAYKTYTIPVGDFYTGQVEYLSFVADNDANEEAGNSYFSNVIIFEDINDNDVDDDCEIITLSNTTPLEEKSILYPNSFSNEITIEVKNHQEDELPQISMTDLLGKEIENISISIEEKGNMSKVSLSNLSGMKSGIYLIRLKIANEEEVFRVIKK
ncbi:MAG: beta-galactosidase [Cyclobacteriaceae bacterium]